LANAAEDFFRSKDIRTRLLKVPGALELPLALKWALEADEKRQIQGVVACGVVIKGDTYHFEMVANESARGLSDLSLKFGIPVGHAVLATYDLAQAIKRAQGDANKGTEAASAVWEMIQLEKTEHFRLRGPS